MGAESALLLLCLQGQLPQLPRQSQLYHVAQAGRPYSALPCAVAGERWGLFCIALDPPGAAPCGSRDSPYGLGLHQVLRWQGWLLTPGLSSPPSNLQFRLSSKCSNCSVSLSLPSVFHTFSHCSGSRCKQVTQLVGLWITFPFLCHLA